MPPPPTAVAATAAVAAPPVVFPSARAAGGGGARSADHATAAGASASHGPLIQLDVSADDDRLHSGFDSSTGRLKMGASASTGYYCRPGVSHSTAPGRSITSLQASSNNVSRGSADAALEMPPAPTAACIGRAPPSPRSRGAADDVSFLFNWLAEQQGDSCDATAPMLLPPPMSAVLRSCGAPAGKAGAMNSDTAADAASKGKAGNPFRR